MSMSTILDLCHYWSPDLEKQPLVPEPYKNFRPLHPLCFARTSPKSMGRGWFWVYECTICGKERVMSSSSILYSECQCKSFDKPRNYPIVCQATCESCATSFTYIKKSKLHEVKYCSNDCRTEAKKLANKEFNERLRNSRFLRSFDRTTFCLRQPNGKVYEICDNYHECQTYRVMYDIFGPFYKEDNSCYVYNAINLI